MDNLWRELGGNRKIRAVIACSDDVAVVIEGESRTEVAMKTHQIMEEIERWCNKTKIRIALNKTQFALLKGRLERDPIIKLGKGKIKRKAVNSYLGI